MTGLSHYESNVNLALRVDTPPNFSRVYFSFDDAVDEESWTTGDDDSSPAAFVDIIWSKIDDDISQTNRSGSLIVVSIIIHFQLNKIQTSEKAKTGD